MLPPSYMYANWQRMYWSNMYTRRRWSSLGPLIMLVLMRFTDNGGCLWWFKDHPEYLYIQEVQKYLMIVKRVVDRFMPSLNDHKYKYKGELPEYSIAMQDWNDGSSDDIGYLE